MLQKKSFGVLFFALGVASVLLVEASARSVKKFLTFPQVDKWKDDPEMQTWED